MSASGSTRLGSEHPSAATGGLEVTFDYHQRTKHHDHRYAPAPGYMDWQTEPNPFRHYRGAKSFRLDHLPPETAPRPHYDELFGPATGGPVQVPNRQSLSQLLYDSLSLSAWKEYRDSRWSLRVNPSSGDLHPTEAYMICGAIPGLHDRPAVYHYCPLTHALEVRRELTEQVWYGLTRGLPPRALLVGLTSIYWRESWKYGERAFRYCQHDLGHAIAAVALAAAVLEWETRLLEAMTSDDLKGLLGVHGQQGIEAEHPESLLVVYPRASKLFTLNCQRAYQPSRDLLAEIGDGEWHGHPNRLSTDHRAWPIIDTVSQATLKLKAPDKEFWTQAAPPSRSVDRPDRKLSARQIIRQRRSAVALDGKTSLDRRVFYQMLERVLPGAVPFTALPWRPSVHLLLFVHRVEAMAPGLYLLVRDPDRIGDLQATITRRFEWRRPQGCPAGMHLYRLRETNCRRAAQMSSCHQKIAADGAFVAGMLGEFEPRLSAHGAWFYRRLHWEAGAIGQVLYLEAEAAGVGSTGIGCFFDDATHEILGLTDRRYQTIYHFTVGGPVEDTRLTSLPGYPALPSSNEDPLQDSSVDRDDSSVHPPKGSS